MYRRNRLDSIQLYTNEHFYNQLRRMCHGNLSSLVLLVQRWDGMVQEQPRLRFGA